MRCLSTGMHVLPGAWPAIADEGEVRGNTLLCRMHTWMAFD